MGRPATKKAPLREDQQALAAQWVPLAYRLAGRYAAANPGLDADDLRGVALESLVHAARCFDPGRGVKFPTYFGRAVGLNLRSESARQRAAGLGGLTSDIRNGRLRGTAPALGELAADPPGREADPAADAERREAERAARGALAAVGDRRRQALLLRHADGHTVREVGQALGVSRQRAGEVIEAALAACLRALREQAGVACQPGRRVSA
jgi:RNA polymerase sigma factor (sigma-70 family)